MVKLQILQCKAWWKPLSGVYASSLALRPSRWRHVAYSGGLLIVLSSIFLLPLQGWLLWIGSLPMLLGCYWLFQKWQQPLTTTMLSIASCGDMRWLGDKLPPGKLMPESLVCGFGIWLYWRDPQHNIRQFWLYQDNLSDVDFRALARHCQLVRWQHQSDSV